MKLLTTQQAAKLLGLGVSTVKRLCASNQLIVIRTPGGHRRISLESVLELGKNRTLHVVPQVRQFDVRLTPQSLLELLLRSEQHRIKQSLEPLLERQPIAQIFDELIAPTFWSLGRLCCIGELEVYKCFLASSRLKEILMWLRHLVQARVSCEQLLSHSKRSRPVAVGACVGEEMHEIPSLMVELILLEQGYSTINLGCCVPVDCVIRATRDHQASIVWTSYSYLGNLSVAVRENHILYAAIEQNAQLLVGGAALTSRVRSMFRYSHFLESMIQLLEWSGRDSTPLQQAA